MKPFRCGHERTPENSKKIAAGRWATCRQCANERHRLDMRRRRERERAARPVKLPRDPTVASERRIVAVRKRISAKARERIEQGLAAHTASQAAVRHAQFAIEAENALRSKLADPIEQAKAMLRRRYVPVLSAETTGGPAGHFYVGRKLVTQDEMLEMAEKVAA